MLLETVEHETAPEPQTSIIWLHGLGADGHDFEPVVPALSLGAERPLRFVFPHAPVRPVTVNGGVPMRAWFDIISASRDAAEDQQGIWQSVAAVAELVQREKERGIAGDRILMAGFSQGGAIALITALTHDEKLAGIIALSTFLPIADEVGTKLSAANRGIEVFMGHGVHDSMVSFRYGRNSRRKLTDFGARVSWHEYPMDHGVMPDEVADIRQFLNRIVKT